jgi:hypothetical protein
MREDNPATEIANSIAMCVEACAMLASPRLWAWLCTTKPPDARRDMILDALSWFIEAAPLDDAVRWSGGPKGMVRNAAAVAAKMKLVVDTWDATTDPPPALAAMGREFLTCIGIPEDYELPVPGEKHNP